MFNACLLQRGRWLCVVVVVRLRIGQSAACAPARAFS